MTVLSSVESGNGLANDMVSQERSLSSITGSIGRTSLMVFAVTALALFGWSFNMPMSGGVIATGVINVEANRRSVQSKDGGTIKELHVTEGSNIAKGDIVVTFDRVQAKADYEVLNTRYLRLRAKQDRLISEFERLDEIHWSKELTQYAANSFVSQLRAFEQDFHATRQKHFQGRRDVLKSRIADFQGRLEATRQQIDTVGEQLKLIREEEETVKELVRDGLEKRPRLLALQRVEADLLGEVAELTGEVSAIREGENAAKLELANLDYERMTEVVGDLADLEGDLLEIEERRQSAANLLANTELRAPESGTVVDLHFFGAGGVVNPSEPIFDLVPNTGSLIVVAQLRLTDIDAAYVSQPAMVRLLSYNVRHTEPLDGKVVHVSADSLKDADGEAYYEIHVQIDTLSGPGFDLSKLQPGMPVDVVLTTEERTFVEYLMSPFSRAMFLAFREE